MRLFLRLNFLFLSAFTSGRAHAAAITFDEKDAFVWLPMQSITGRVNGTVTRLKLYCNNVAYAINLAPDNTFKVNIKLTDGQNKIWVSGIKDNNIIESAELNLTLAYHPMPVAKPYAVVAGDKAVLNATITDNPSGKTLKYLWVAAKNNPAVCKIANKTALKSSITVPAKPGAYYFTFLAISGTDTACFQTYITRGKNGLHAYNVDKDHAAWIDSAIIYEINPSVFVKNGTYDAITAKLPEIKDLGVNTLWIQPVYQTDDPGQGYSVTDYFTLRDDYGTNVQLANLISTAKKLHLRVMFDFVANHTSIYHPYAQDCIKYGDSSHYYKFYQRVNDHKPYSIFYHTDKNGFMSYFWDNLVNLDYNNPEVQQWMLQATEYWLKKYDLDGYRFDAIWGINARSPQFTKRLATELKSIKPDILLLAEDKASDKTVYDSGLDAAYDWTADTSWVSQWAWQTHHSTRKSLTVFNMPDSTKRKATLSKAIFKNSSLSNRSLRFIENNDVPRFIATHTLQQTKMAAALVFTVPGIPMLYNGQEVGCDSYPYARKTIFTTGKTIQQADSLGLFPYYKKLIQLHQQYAALSSTSIREVSLLNNPYMLAFERWKGDEHFIMILNLNVLPANAQLNLNGIQDIKPGLVDKSCLQDVLTDNVFKISGSDKQNMQIPMEGYGIRWLLLK